MWGIDDEGSRVLIIDRSFPPYFYLVLDGKKDAKSVLERVRQRESELPLVAELELTR